MGKVILGQKGIMHRRRLPPIPWAETACQPDKQKVPPVQWTDLYIPATKCPSQQQGLTQGKAKGHRLEENETMSPDLLPSDCGVSKRKKRWECSRHHKKPSQHHGSRNSITLPETTNLEDLSTNNTTTGSTVQKEFPQNSKVQKIHIDLRACLENVALPWGSWEQSSEASSTSGGSHTPVDDEELIEEAGKETAHTMRPNKLGSGRNLSLKDNEKPFYKLPPTFPPPQTNTTHEEKGSPYSRRGRSRQSRVSLVEVMGDGTLGSQMSSECNAKISAVFSKMILQPDNWMQPPGRRKVAEIMTEDSGATRPEYSADLQIPTALLLQRLRDHTNSEHHQLIAQVLCSLRQAPGTGPMVQRVVEAPACRQKPSEDHNQWKSKRKALQNIHRRLAPGSISAPEMGIAKFTWQKSSPQFGGSVPRPVPQAHRWKGHSDQSSFWIAEDSPEEPSWIPTSLVL